jgi:hypothetical protein
MLMCNVILTITTMKGCMVGQKCKQRGSYPLFLKTSRPKVQSDANTYYSSLLTCVCINDYLLK